MSAILDTAVIGAGPYGLSIAAHLAGLGIEFRIFGIPMRAWTDHMPAGMHLKSDGSSSDLADPDGRFTLKSFCARRGYEHHPTQLPVPVEQFIEYGLAFQERFVPQVESRMLVFLEKPSSGFRLHFSDGETVTARRVILALGVAPFSHIPASLNALPQGLVSHSSQYGPTDRLSGRRIAIVGGGASALDLAALLHERGTDVSIIARNPRLVFHGYPVDRSLWRRVLRPGSRIGNGWRLRIFSDAPLVFHALPERLRRHQAGTLLGPATGWFMKERLLGKVHVLTGFTPREVSVRNGLVHLAVSAPNGDRRELDADHVIAATGYRIDLSRLTFLDERLRSRIRTAHAAPVLSSNFESSVPGLYVVGPAAMNSFGPVVRFVYGARYTARRLSRHLAEARARVRQVPATVATEHLRAKMGAGSDLASP